MIHHQIYLSAELFFFLNKKKPCREYLRVLWWLCWVVWRLQDFHLVVSLCHFHMVGYLGPSCMGCSNLCSSTID